MKFIWNRRKNESNIKKHELDFADAFKVFESPLLVNSDERHEYGEERWIGIGLMDANRGVGLYLPNQKKMLFAYFHAKSDNGRARKL